MATTIATHLVLESIRTNQIINHVIDLAAGEGAGDLLDELAEMAEDSVDANGGVTEFWGADEDGNEWRVHVRLDGVDAAIETEAKAAENYHYTINKRGIEAVAVAVEKLAKPGCDPAAWHREAEYAANEQASETRFFVWIEIGAQQSRSGNPEIFSLTEADFDLVRDEV